MSITLELNLHGRHQQQIYQQPIIRIGRSSDNDVIILDEQVSRYHAILQLDQQGIVAQDLESNYGLRLSSGHIRNAKQSIDNKTKIYFSSHNDLFIEVHHTMAIAKANKTNEQQITTLEKLLWLLSNPMFQSLNHQSLLSIARNSRLLIYNQDDILCEQGKPATSLLVLISGVAQSQNRSIYSGQMVGEAGVLAQTNYTETVVASSPKVPVLAIAASSFEALLDREPQIARALLVSISQMLQTKL